MRKSRDGSGAGGKSSGGGRTKKPLLGRLVRGAGKAKAKAEHDHAVHEAERPHLKDKLVKGAALVQEALNERSGASGMAEEPAPAPKAPAKTRRKPSLKGALVKAVKRKVAKARS